MFHDLTAIVVMVRASRTYYLRQHMGRALQQVFLRHVVEPHNPDLSRQLHDTDEAKPYAVSGLMIADQNKPFAGNVNAGDVAWFRLIALSREVGAALREWVLNPPDIIEIDTVPWHVDSVHYTRRDHYAANSSSYRALIDDAYNNPPDRKISLVFPISTAFHRAGMNVPFPLPALVFGSLIRQWETFSGIPLPPHLRDFIDYFVMLQRYTLQTEMLNFKQGSKQVGFTGSITYEINRRNAQAKRAIPDVAPLLEHEHQQLAQILHMLTDFSFYSGVGIKTSAGMGMVLRS